jgi:D-alanine-D-alanine ligase
VARAVKKLRVLVLVHEDFLAPESLEGLPASEAARIKTEYDVVSALAAMNHEVRQLGVSEELRPIRQAVQEWRPHIVFNLLEEFQDEAIFDQNIVGYLELLRVPYTGCNPRALVLARDKALSKKLLTYHRIRVPRFFVVRRGRMVRRPTRVDFPLIVKSLLEESSAAIAKTSLVRNEENLAERVAFVHERLETDAIVEQFVPGREIYVGVLGNQRLQVLPAQELVIRKSEAGEPLIATEKVKHDLRYQKERGVEIVRAPLSETLERQIERTSKRIFRTLQMWGGYARIDYRVDENEHLYCLEANPNPEIARREEMALAAMAAGMSYEELLQRILNLGIRRKI